MSDGTETLEAISVHNPRRLGLDDVLTRAETLAPVSSRFEKSALPQPFPPTGELLVALATDKNDRADAPPKGKKSESMPQAEFTRAITDLNDDDFDKRWEAVKKLASQAPLKQLVDFQASAQGLSMEQSLKLEQAVQLSVKNFWEKFSGDPKANPPDVTDPVVAARLLAGAPSELRHADETNDSVRDLLSGTGKHSKQEIEEAVRKEDRVAAFADWLDQAAKQDGALPAVKKAANDFLFEASLARIGASAAHLALAHADEGQVSDAKSISDDQKNAHMIAAKQFLNDALHSSNLEVHQFSDLLLSFSKGDALDTKEFESTVKTLADRVMAPGLTARLQDDDRSFLLGRLPELKGLRPDSAKFIDEQIGRLSDDFEKRVSQLHNVYDRFDGQSDLISRYYELGMVDRAKGMLKQARLTANLFSDGVRDLDLKRLDNKWGKKLGEQ